MRTSGLTSRRCLWVAYTVSAAHERHCVQQQLLLYAAVDGATASSGSGGCLLCARQCTCRVAGEGGGRWTSGKKSMGEGEGKALVGDGDGRGGRKLDSFCCAFCCSPSSFLVDPRATCAASRVSRANEPHHWSASCVCTLHACLRPHTRMRCVAFFPAALPASV